MSLSTTLLQASELGIRLEIVNGLPIWEAQPVYRHQKHIERIVQGIEQLDTSECECVHAVDVYVQ
ncbi:MAG: Uma2 family endonuclease, partial [Candidatus Electrothrix sp. AR1]|nr:Uma2 family endonuclease [Candidatus Electrothrix sp. AR1]